MAGKRRGRFVGESEYIKTTVGRSERPQPSGLGDDRAQHHIPEFLKTGEPYTPIGLAVAALHQHDY